MKFLKKYKFELIIFFLSFLIRLFYIFEIKDEYFFKSPILDGKIYHAMAMDINKNGWLSGKVYFMNPGYPLFLSIVYHALGDNIFSIAMIQSILSSVAAVLVFIITRSFTGVLGAFISGILYLFFAPAMFYDGLLFSAAMINFFNSLILFFLFLFYRTIIKQERDLATNVSKMHLFSLLSGISLGLSALFRPNILIFSLFVIIFFLYLGMKFIKFKNYLIIIILFFSGLFFILTPVVLRNYKIDKQFVLTTSSGGVNFYLGNNEEAQGTNNPPSFARLSPDNILDDFRNEASIRTGKYITAKETSGYWFKEAINFIKRSPRKYIKLIFRKFILFHNFYEIPSNLNMYFVAQYSKILKHNFLDFSILFAFGYAGMFLIIVSLLKPGNSFIKNRFEFVFIIFSFYLCYLFSNMQFFILSEYRLPVFLPLSIFAGISIINVFDLVRDKINFSKILKLSLAMTIIISVFLFSKHKFYTERSFDKPYIAIGMSKFREKDYLGAIKEFQSAISLNPKSKEAYLNSGTCLFNLGKIDEAEVMFKKAIDISPDFADGHLNLGGIYYIKKDFPAAEREYKIVILLMPNHSEGILNLAHSLFMQKKFPEAKLYYLEAQKLLPDNQEIKKYLGFCK